MLYWQFQCFSLDETITNTYFLVSLCMYCSGQLIHCLKISGNKNNLRTIWVWNRQKIKNSPFSPDIYWFLLKKSVYICTVIFHSNVGFSCTINLTDAVRQYWTSLRDDSVRKNRNTFTRHRKNSKRTIRLKRVSGIMLFKISRHFKGCSRSSKILESPWN